MIDQVTKHWASSRGLVVTNSGISFGWLAGVDPIFLTIILVGLWSVVTIFLWRSSQLNPWGKAMIIGGGLSNLIDRVMLGGVRDWLPVPGFQLQNNLADYALALGFVVLLTFDYYRTRTKGTS